MNIDNFHLRERFKRNTIIPSIGLAGQQMLFDGKVLVAGAGGLGSGVIAGLASAGIGNIGIIDVDAVDLSNLNRQFIHSETSLEKPKVESAYNWVKNYNSRIKTDTFKTQIDYKSDTNYFKNYKIVIDCFDSYKSKFILNKICAENNLPLIHGGVEEFYGQVLTIIPGRSSCLNCLFDTYDTDKKGDIGVISPTVNVISSIQSMEAVKFLLGIEDLLVDTLLTYDGIKQEFRKIKLNKRKNCISCGSI